MRNLFIRILFIFTLGLLYPLPIKAQTSTIYLDEALSGETNLSILQIMDIIENQSNYSFIYDGHIVNVSQPCRISSGNYPVFDLLNLLFSTTDIVYTIINEKIILNRQETILNIQESPVYTVKGKVLDKNRHPVIGTTIRIKNTNKGSISDLNGEFILPVEKNELLTFSYIGYKTAEIRYTGQTMLEVILTEDTQLLEEVVVTALGIRKKDVSLTYSLQQVPGVAISKNKDVNLINALSGKIAGVQINRSSAGVGGSAKVVIRGGRSVSGNNQPLYVLDGIPILNSSNEQAISIIGGTADGGNRDGGDGVSNLNPEDIESINILKGASAAALYGAQAANGVVLISTKKGNPDEHTIRFSSHLAFDKAISIPEFQSHYMHAENTKHSWGSKGNTPYTNNVNNFFNTGFTSINALSLTTGNDKMQTYFSYANTTSKGIIETHKLNKHNVNLRETASFFNNKLKLDGNVNLIRQTVNNRPVPGGFYMNPLVGLYTFPVGNNLNEYKENFEVYSEKRNMPVQNWYSEVNDGFDQNPYWLIYRAPNTDKRTRILTTLSATLELSEHFSLQARGNMDHIQDKYQQKIYASTSPSIAGNNGRYIDYSYQETLLYGDLMAIYTNKWNKISLNAVVGTSISDNRVSSLRIDSKTASLYFPNVFTITNIQMSSSAFIDEKNDHRRQIQSLYATTQLGYNEMLFFDITARNDWSSTLAFTDSKNKGFFYPSFGLSYILTEQFLLPDRINFGKLRASWSKVGNDIPLFVSNSVAHIGAGGAPQPNDTAPFDKLKPEMSSSFEIGTEWKFFNYRLDLDLTIYRTNTRNQLFTLPSMAGAEYKYYYVNAGNIQNQGIELSVTGVPFITPSVKWQSTLNLSANKNTIKQLHDELPSFIPGDEGFSSSYTMRWIKGGSFGDIYGKAFDRYEAGNIKYGDDNLPMIAGSGNTIKVGNCNPKFMAGWSNTISYKNISLYFLLDGRFGGDVLSQTQAVLDERGVSKASGEARDRGYIDLEGFRIDDVQGFYEKIGGRDGVTEYYMYSGTTIRLREASLTYNFPVRTLKTNFIKEAQIALTGRNICFLYKKAPFDPEVILSTENNNQGVDAFGTPSTRSTAINLKLTF